MTEHTNALAGKLPKTPNPALRQLDRLVGERRISGPDVEGIARYSWMEGGFFLVEEFDFVQGGEHYKGIQYTSFDEETSTLRSRLMGMDGSRFMDTYGFDDDTMSY